MCQHSRAHPDWDCVPAEGTFVSDNTMEARIRYYGRDRLGDPLGEPFELAPGVIAQQFWNALVIEREGNCTILPDASVVWPMPTCDGSCGNCRPDGTPLRTTRYNLSRKE